MRSLPPLGLRLRRRLVVVPRRSYRKKSLGFFSHKSEKGLCERSSPTNTYYSLKLTNTRHCQERCCSVPSSRSLPSVACPIISPPQCPRILGSSSPLRTRPIAFNGALCPPNKRSISFTKLFIKASILLLRTIPGNSRTICVSTATEEKRGRYSN